MAVIDIDKLLQEASTDSPCGEDLEYDPAFTAMAKAAQPKEPSEFEPNKPPEPPDWRTVQQKALDLLGRTKDLRPAVHLTRALLHTGGLAGLRDGLSLLRGLLEKYWAAVHPQLDPDDDYDPTMRVNVLASLCDREFMLRDLRETPLVSSALLGSFSLRDIDIATGALKLSAGSQEKPAELSSIDGAFMEGDLEQLQGKARAVRESINQVAAIESYVTDQVGVANAPNLDSLTRVLKEIHAVLSDRLARRGVTEPSAAAATPAATNPAEEAPMEQPAIGSMPSVAATLPQEISSREDVVRTLDKLCAYYERFEPSSPVPMLLQRARRLVTMSFMEILQDLAPDAVPKVETIQGTGKEPPSGKGKEPPKGKP